jgi:integrase/recombinase XerD
MSQGKQAKILTDEQVEKALFHLNGSRYPNKYKVMFLLSAKAGLRAMEIASVKWSMVTDPEGNLIDIISLPDKATKKKNGGGDLPVNKQLFEALQRLYAEGSPDLDDYIIPSERGDKMTANSVVMWFWRIYKALNFDGCSSHSGRRTFITKAGKAVAKVGGSIRDVQQLARHSSLQSTQPYMEGDSVVKRKLVQLV